MENRSFTRSKTEAQQLIDSSPEAYKGQSVSVMLYESASIELIFQVLIPDSHAVTLLAADDN